MSRYVGIPGYEGRYAISEDGSVVSFLSGSPRTMKPVIQRGYRCVGLRDHEGRRRFHGIHRLLLTAFVRTPQEGEQARHLNDDRLDNRLSNLAWGSLSENMQDAIGNGRNPWLSRTHCPQGHPYDVENTYIQRNGHRKCVTCVRRRSSLYAHRGRRRLTEAGKPMKGGAGE